MAWQVTNARTGDVIGAIEAHPGAHNTTSSSDGERVYLASLRSPVLSVLDARTLKIASEVGPFDNVICPFTVNGSNTLVFVNINVLLGLEVGDLPTGKKLCRVDVNGCSQVPV